MRIKCGCMMFFMFFLISFFAEVYCILEFRTDMITIIGVGVVLLIATYLWIDSLRELYIEEMKKIDEKFAKLEKLERSIYGEHKKAIRLLAEYSVEGNTKIIEEHRASMEKLQNQLNIKTDK